MELLKYVNKNITACILEQIKNSDYRILIKNKEDYIETMKRLNKYSNILYIPDKIIDLDSHNYDMYNAMLSIYKLDKSRKNKSMKRDGSSIFIDEYDYRALYSSIRKNSNTMKNSFY
jgi:hypothetical protein